MRKHQPSPASAISTPASDGPDQAGAVDQRRVQGDGVGQVFLALDHLDEERLPRRHVEGVDQRPGTRLRATTCQMVGGARFAAEGDHRQQGRLDQRQYLRDDEEAVAVPAIDEDAGERSQEEGRHLAGEADQAEQEGRVRAAEAEDEPAGGDARHPGADQRDALADEEQPVVAVGQGPPQRSEYRPCTSADITPPRIPPPAKPPRIATPLEAYSANFKINRLRPACT